MGSQAVRLLSSKGLDVVGIDNDMRRTFFGESASIAWNRKKLKEDISSYIEHEVDLRDAGAVEKIFHRYGTDLALIIHAAAQPSHDWAASDPVTDFTVNANATLVLLEAMRQFCPDSIFIFVSTNKVYGDTPNRLPLVELDTRWELEPSHPFHAGVDESMSLDQSKHSLFGVSKAAADLLVQEYGRYFELRTGVFRCGCTTGPAHSGAQLHGFLAYLMQCALSGDRYTVMGYQGKQVRDNIHSYDLVNQFWHFFQSPRTAEVYNSGGGRHSNCSILEAIEMCESISGKSVNRVYSDNNRSGDHIWWISDARKFQSHYTDWTYDFSLEDMLADIHDGIRNRRSG